MNLIVLGAPGSGKSTQAELLAKFMDVPCLETSNLLYYLSQENSKVGQEIKKIMESGDLVEDELTIETMSGQLKSPNYKNGVVIDGFPRSLTQAQKFKFPVDKVLYIKVSDKENTKRLLKRGRKDDTAELIKKRLEIYHQETEPVLEFYRQKGILLEVNGEQLVETIHQEILKNLGS